MNSSGSLRSSGGLPRKVSTTVFDTDRLLTHGSVLFNPITTDFEIEKSEVIATTPMHTVSNVLSTIDGKRKTIFTYYNVPEASIPRISREWDNLITLSNTKTTPNNLYHYRCYLDQIEEVPHLTLYVITEQISGTLGYLHENNLLSFQDKVKMLYDVSRTLAYLKGKKYTHKNLNLDTIMVESDDHGRKTFKLSNWAAWSELTIESTEIKAHYAHFYAPELKKLKGADLSIEAYSRADVYSLSVVFMQLMGFTINELKSFDAKKIKSRHSFTTPFVREALCKLILEGMSSEPEQRPSIESFYEKISSIYYHKSDIENIDPVRFAGYLRGEPYHKTVDFNYQINGDYSNSNNEEKSKNNHYLSQILKSKRNARFLIMAAYALMGFPVLVIIISLLTMVQKSSSSSVDPQLLTSGLRAIYDGIGYAPISDVYVTSKENNCSEGYNQATFGAYTSTSSFTYWNGSRICVKRDTGFINSTREGLNNQSYMACSQGVWVSVNSSCPVTDIVVSNSTQPNASLLQIGEGMYLNLIREQNKTPISQFRLSINNSLPCFSGSETAVVFDQRTRNFNQIGCKAYGTYPNASSFDNETTLVAFSDQDWGKQFLLQANFNSTAQNLSAQLYLLPRMGLVDNDNCMSYNATNLIGCFENDIDSWQIVIVLLVTALIISLVAGIGYVWKVLECKDSAKDLLGVIRINYAYFALAALPLLIGCYLTVKNSSNIDSCYSSIQPLQHCLTYPNASQVVSDTSLKSDEINERSTRFFILLGLSGACFILSLLAFFAIWLPERDPKDVESSQTKVLLEQEKNWENKLSLQF